MPVSSDPYDINFTMHSPVNDKYLNVRTDIYYNATSIDGRDDYVVDSNNSPHYSDDHSTLYVHRWTDHYYLSIAQGLHDSTPPYVSWGWGLTTTKKVNVTGSSSSQLVTNGQSGAVINFQDAGKLYLSNGNNVTVNANNGPTTVNGGGGDIHTSTSGGHEFYLNEINYLKLTTGGAGDKITLTSNNNSHNTVHSGGGIDEILIDTNSHDNTIYGEGDGDKITVNGHHNHVEGDDGNDLITVAGSNNLVFGDNASTPNGGSGQDKITISGLYNTVWGGGGVDEIEQTSTANPNPDEIHGGSGNDKITITSYNTKQVEGGDNDDVITIGNWNSDVEGGNDKDTIHAGSGNNIYGGHGVGTGNDSQDEIDATDYNHIWGDADKDKIVSRNGNTIHGGSAPDHSNPTDADVTSNDSDDTIQANNGNWIYGDRGKDSIVANDDNHVWGNDGSDVIWVNDKNWVAGGGNGVNGTDTIFASEYNTVYGGVMGLGTAADDGWNGGTEGGSNEGDGADSIKVEVGNKVYAGGGNDSVLAGDANLIAGNAGDDSIDAGDKDSIAGGDGKDCIKAGEHAYIDAGANNDTVDAKFNSSIWGADGNDSINILDRSYVNAGNDDDSVWAIDDNTIYGAAGKDYIKATDGNLIYGDGTDSVNVSSSISSYNTTHGALDNLWRNESGNAGNDTIEVRNLNTIHGGWGNDSIIGTDFNLSYGDAGNDSIFLKSNNSIWGGAGSDIIQATDFNLIYGDDSAGSDAGWGNDSVVARTDNTIYGGAGNDTLIADDRAKIDGGIGNDSLTFGQNSSIIAGEGDDTIVSQAPGALTAPNGSSGSSIWGGKGGVDTLGHAINYVDSVGSGVDGKGHAYTTKPHGGRDIHGHNIYTGADADVTIMDFKFGNDVIHFGRAFEASAITAFGYGNSTIVPTTDYQIYTAGTDRINVAATISDAVNIDMREEAGKFVMFGNPNGTLKGGFANTLLGGKNDDTIYVGEGDYVYGGMGNDTINLNGYNNWRDHVGLTEEGGTDTINSFQQGWGEGDDVIWYNVPLKKQAVGDDGKLLFDTDHNPIYTDANTDAVADLNDANVRVVGDTTVLSQGKAKLILKGVTHGEILAKDADGVHRVALLGQGYYNDSTRGGQIFIGRKEYSDIVSFEKNNHDLVVDLGMTDRFKDKSAKYYNIEQIIGGSGNNTIVGAKNVRNTLDGGIGTSSIWGGGASADVMVSGTGSATDHYTTFFYGAGDGYDTIEGFRTTDRNDAHFKRDILDIHSGDVSSVRKVGTSIVVNMAGSTDRLTIRNAASGLFDQLIEVNVKGRKGAAKVTGADEIVTYDPRAQYYFSNAAMGGTVRNFGDNTRIYLDGRTGDYYKGITNIDVDRGNRLELAGDAANNRITYSGRGTASLYGGLGNDTMTGSKDGMNRFFFGRSDGNDVITKSTVNDKVMLYDVALEDVVSAEEKKGSMRIALKSGARLTIQDFDAKSVHDFTLATGDTWVYNHNATGTGGYWSPKGNYPVQPKA